MESDGPGAVTALIVDDEAPERTRIRDFLAEHGRCAVVGECPNGRAAVEKIIEAKPDLVFMDVRMPGMDGLETCRAVLGKGAMLPSVVFMTEFDQVSIKSFELHSVDYLLKPVQKRRFNALLHRAVHRIETGRSVGDRLRNLLGESRPKEPTPVGRKKIVLKENGRFIFLAIEEIDWVEADGNYVRVHVGDKNHYVRDTLASIEAQLVSGQFARISRSVIVNLDRIKEMQPLFYGDYVVILQNGEKLNLSRSYRGKFNGLMGEA